ncbi:glycerate kinase [Clostridium sp. Cult1]|uniref:glycerate kinase n=1 Tax=Clostridium sp. Cult1 TaxID=2079002 RepID=UPI001F35ADD0|nr:glycerate kinase [Clostridium sp. Cult1]MCF6462830.1 glycerate kinase [Clostridium sp. Cult1]
MKILIAPDSFKENLSAKEVAQAIERGIKKVDENIQTSIVPMADGGEGTVESLVEATDGQIINVKVKDPLMRDIDSYYGVLGDRKTAVIEMAAASGLALLEKDERNPMDTTSFGTGQLIKYAIEEGYKNIIIGIGGSATNDGGAGMLMALGAKILDANGEDIGLGAKGLGKLKSIDLSNFHEDIKDCNFVVACDVDNPLVGKRGASYVFGPQKGADEHMVKILDANLENFGKVVEDTLGISLLQYPGAGAAGGMGAALLAFLDAELERGIDIVIEATQLERKIMDSNLVITGEGKIDGQTQFGKTPYGIATLAKKYNKPVIAIAGGIGEDASVLYEKGIDSIFSIVNKPMTLEEAMVHGESLLEDTAERIIRALIAI